MSEVRRSCEAERGAAGSNGLPRVVWPVRMQSNLQSGEKVPFSTFARAFDLEIGDDGRSLLRTGRSFSKIYNLEQFPVSPGGQLQAITVCNFRSN